VETLENLQQQLSRLPLLQRLQLEGWLQDLNAPPPPSGDRVEEARPAYQVDEPLFMSFEAYFDFEERSSIRHEFVNGFVFAMTGPSVAHVAVAGNLTFAFRSRLKRGPCNVFTSDLKVHIQREANKICYYPDVVVDCRPDAREKYFVRSPKLIVEVLSPSTHVTDRREKLQHCSLIESLEEYVLAAQDEHKIVVYRRADGWRPHTYAGVEAVAEFRSMEWVIPLSEVYADVPDFPDDRL
jgi:Uma2 family endonuclease